MIRRARKTDLVAITEIYNDAILKTTATFDTEPKTVDVCYYGGRPESEAPHCACPDCGRK